MEEKKKRSANFSSREINIFMTCLIPEIQTIENKQTDGSSLKEKQMAWKRVYNNFIGENKEQIRDLSSLKLKYENIKRNLRKKVAENKQELKKTGGGPPDEKELSWDEEQIYSVLQLSMEGLPSEGDCDACVAGKIGSEVHSLTAVETEFIFDDDNYVSISGDPHIEDNSTGVEYLEIIQVEKETPLSQPTTRPDLTNKTPVQSITLQVNLQASQPPQQSFNDSNGTSPSPLEDDIDAALNNLQTTLEGSSISTHSNDITSVPELKDQLRFLKPKRFTLKAYKKYWFTCRDLHLYMYKSREDMVHNSNCVMNINLKGCEVTPDVTISQNKYVIKLEVPSADGMSEMYIRCDDETQYSRWMACCRLAAKGRSLADSSYETEKQTILDFLNLQRRAEEPVINPSSLDIQVEDYIAPKYLRKSRGKLTQRILEAHTNVKDLSLVNAKMNYIKAWQLLPDFGITLFVVKFMDCKKEELLGVAYNRIMKMDINSGDHQKTWRFNTMKAWNVNWEIKHMMVQFEEGNIVFSCLSADCKVVHEFIGGYIFLSTRSKDASQTLNEELFHKLTGGWS